MTKKSITVLMCQSHELLGRVWLSVTVHFWEFETLRIAHYIRFDCPYAWNNSRTAARIFMKFCMIILV
jgi:hypothetical protein